VKRTKNVESANDGKGTSNAPPMATKTSLLMNKDSSVVLDTGHLMLPNSENTPRYDDVLSRSHNLGLSPKVLHSSFSAVAEGAVEYDPVVPRADLISISNKQKNDVLVPEFAVDSEETGDTSITLALHAARRSIHAAPGQEPAAQTPSGPKTASGPAASQPTSHGLFDIMHSEVPPSRTVMASNFSNSITTSKVNEPAQLHVLNNSVETYTPGPFVAQGASNPGLSLAVDTVISCKNLPRYDEVHLTSNPVCNISKIYFSSSSMAVEDSEKYAQTVLPDTVIDNKAGKKTSTVADVHGTCRSDFAGAGRVALATPTISKPSPLVGSASPMGMGPSFRPGMHGPSKHMQTTPTKTTSIHTVTKHKGAEKKR
jgi:hypothetical protein